MNFRIIAFVCMVAVLFSCSKDKSVEKPDNSSVDTASYQPVTIGSTWHYKDGVNPNGGFTLTATDKDTSISGVKFCIFNNKPDTSTQIIETYLGQARKDYYALGLIKTLGDNALLYLKDTLVNATWKQDISLTYQGYHLDAEMDFTLVETNISKEVNNHTYTHVAEVTVQVMVNNPLGGSPINYATGDLYFSRQVGVISATIQESGSTISDISLDSYTIK